MELRKVISEVSEDGGLVELSSQIRELLETRVNNELVIQRAIMAGLKEEMATEGNIADTTVGYVSDVMRKSKDGIDSLMKVHQLLNGGATENVFMSKEEIERKLTMVVNFDASGSLGKLDALVKKLDAYVGQTGEV